MKQLDLFDYVDMEIEPINVLANKKETVKVVRSERQQNNRTAYDVGETVGGSRKAQFQLRESFDQNPTLEKLKDVEKASPLLAEKVVKKAALITLNLEEEKRLGTEPEIAMVKKLLLQRIDSAPSVQTKDQRYLYTRALIELQEQLDQIKNSVDLEDFHREWTKRLKADRDGIDGAQKKVDYYEEQCRLDVVRNNICRFEEIKSYLVEAESYKQYVISVADKPVKVLGKRFCNYFFRFSSRQQTLTKIRNQYKTWNDVLGANQTRVKAKNTKPSLKWQREIPKIIERSGGRTALFTKPESLITTFGLRSVEFGHYVNDDKALVHLRSSAEGFYDLTDVLGLDDQLLSLNNRLSLAYGARGSGNAVGHYEPLAKIINLTRDKGMLAILAHEYAHALDHFVYDASYNFEVEALAYASEQSLGPACSNELEQSRRKLYEVMFSGTASEMIECASNNGVSWKLPNSWTEFYRVAKGDLSKVMTLIDKDLRYRYEISADDLYIAMGDGNTYQAKRRNSQIRKYKRNRVSAAQAIAWYHEQQTKQQITHIPYPVYRSDFFQHSISMDKGKIGKYWSTGREMFARAFESYIQDRLLELGRKNDYLVSGTRVSDMVFPQAEERMAMNKAMGDYLNLVKKEIFYSEK